MSVFLLLLLCLLLLLLLLLIADVELPSRYTVIKSLLLLLLYCSICKSTVPLRNMRPLKCVDSRESTHWCVFANELANAFSLCFVIHFVTFGLFSFLLFSLAKQKLSLYAIEINN